MRQERMLRLAAYALLGVIFLYLLHVMNRGESKYNLDARNSAVQEYDYYMDDVSYDADGDGTGESFYEDKSDDVSSSDVEKEKKKYSTPDEDDDAGKPPPPKADADSVVVSVDDKELKKSGGDKKSGGGDLEAPRDVGEEDRNSEDFDDADDDEDDVAGSEVLVDDVAVEEDEDQDLFLAASNASMEALENLIDGSVNFTHYLPEHLIPVLMKPPIDREAPGEMGHPFEIPKRMGPSVGGQIEEGYRRFAFNVLVSDIISVHRNLGDHRELVCKETKFKVPLPTCSVIITFRNEAFSTLARTLYSVLETVPAILLTELIIVDDFSHPDLFEQIKKEFEELDMVKLIRLPEPSGLVAARNHAVEHATGEVLVFVDSHCECYEAWVENLLNRISSNNQVVAVPIIEIINPDTFKFSLTPMYRAQRGGFDWSLTYRWIQPDKERFQHPKKTPDKPIETATLSGSVFAIHKAFFTKLGGFDPGMRQRGGESLELSFKTWMCGGRIEIIPCSHVGHVFKSRSVHNIPPEVVLTNKKRVATTWMDDYVQQYVKRTPAARTAKAGNVTSRVELRNNLKCKPFSWFVEKVYPELYIPELNPVKSGALCCRFGKEANICLDAKSSETIVPGRPMSVGKFHEKSLDQYFELTKDQELRQPGARDFCLGANERVLRIQKCKFPAESKEAPDSQKWILQDNGLVMNAETRACLTATISHVTLESCNLKSANQKWKWNKQDHLADVTGSRDL